MTLNLSIKSFMKSTHSTIGNTLEGKTWIHWLPELRYGFMNDHLNYNHTRLRSSRRGSASKLPFPEAALSNAASARLGAASKTPTNFLRQPVQEVQSHTDLHLVRHCRQDLHQTHVGIRVNLTASHNDYWLSNTPSIELMNV